MMLQHFSFCDAEYHDKMRGTQIGASSALSTALGTAWQGPLSIPLAKISLPLKGRWLDFYRMESEQLIDSLNNSIGSIGQTTPLYCVSSNDGRFVVVSGIRRVLALRARRASSASVMFVGKTTSSPLQLLSFRLNDNRSFRPVSTVDSMLTISSLQQCGVSIEEIATSWATLLSLHPTVDTVEDYLALRDSPLDLMKLLFAGRITIQQAVLTARQQRRNRKVIIRLLENTKWNNREFADTLQLIDDCSFRDNMTFEKVLENCGILEIFDNSSLNPRERGNQIHRSLRRTRYPILGDHERKFLDLIAHLHLPPAISVNPPRNFEGDLLQILISCRSPEQMRSAIKKLSDLADDENDSLLEKLFDFF